MTLFILFLLVGCQTKTEKESNKIVVESDISTARDESSLQIAQVEVLNESANLTTAKDTINQLSLVLNVPVD